MMDLREKKSRALTFFEWLFLSLFLHFTFSLALYFHHQPEKKEERIEVQLIEQETPELVKEESKQVVEQDEKPVNDEIDKKAKYLSAHNQKVQKQTVAKKHGEFKNVNSFTPKYDISKAVQELEAKEKDSLKQTKEVHQPQPAVQANSSATIDYIKDLDPGLETMLSTREFVYYTYYSRIRKQLNQFWGTKVKEKMTKIYREGRQIASTEDKITKCLITLDKIGNLVKVQIIGISGIRELDEAAVEAFRLAAPFPNPPTGIIEQDGNIKLRWDFILEM